MARFFLGDKVRCLVTWSDADESIRAGNKPSPGSENRLMCVVGDEGIVVSFEELWEDPQWPTIILGGRYPSSRHDFDLLNSLKNKWSKMVTEGQWVPIRFHRYVQIPSGKTRAFSLGQVHVIRPEYLVRTM